MPKTFPPPTPIGFHILFLKALKSSRGNELVSVLRWEIHLVYTTKRSFKYSCSMEQLPSANPLYLMCQIFTRTVFGLVTLTLV